MDQIMPWHTMYKTKLVIPSTQTDILPQHKLFLCGYAELNQTVYIIIIIIIIKGLLRNTFWHPKVNCNMLTET